MRVTSNKRERDLGAEFRPWSWGEKSDGGSHNTKRVANKMTLSLVPPTKILLEGVVM